MTPEEEKSVIAGVAAIQEHLKAQDGVLKDHTDSLKALTYTLNGNGVPGLKQIVASHESTLTLLKRVVWILITPLLAAAGGGLVTLLVWGVRHIAS